MHFAVDEGTLKAVDGLSFAIEERQVFGLIGESGCGKTVTAQSLMRLVPKPGRIVNGGINYRTELGGLIDLAQVDPAGAAIRSVRGNEIGDDLQRADVEPVANPQHRQSADGSGSAARHLKETGSLQNRA